MWFCSVPFIFLAFLSYWQTPKECYRTIFCFRNYSLYFITIILCFPTCFLRILLLLAFVKISLYWIFEILKYFDCGLCISENPSYFLFIESIFFFKLLLLLSQIPIKIIYISFL